jgi:hypothetical protein
VRLKYAAHCIGRKGLNASNIKSLYKSAGVDFEGEDFLEIGKAYFAQYPDIVNDPQLKSAAQKNLWLKYHSNISSAKELSMRMIESFPCGSRGRRARERAIGDAGMQWYRKALNTAFSDDKEVHLQPNMRLLAFVYAFLKATKTFPDQTWWQGEKAVAQMSPMEYRMIHAAFEKIVDLNQEQSGMDYALDQDDVLEQLTSDSSLDSARDKYLIAQAVPSTRDVEKEIKNLVKEEVTKVAATYVLKAGAALASK